ncbi:MAG: signal peptidase I [Gammaproteobacteria bacterium]|jgi:signal peptidase I
MKIRLRKIWSENKYLVIFVVLMSVFRSGVADWNVVPTGSMKPTIVEGDRILVNKMAYDIRIPFTHVSLVKLADPARGDIVVFDSKKLDERLVKRVVGLPGDIVAMDDNVLTINGRELQYDDQRHTKVVVDKVENLLGVEHLVRTFRPHGGELSSFPPVKVPDDQYLMLGDNRDNSADSRVIGFVPRNEIVGRTREVVMSLNYDNYYIPRSDRFFHSLSAIDE